MPNWSSNALIVKSNGSKEGDRDLDEFFERIHATEGDTKNGIFHAFVPIDQKLYESEAWYNWCPKNWGTKWEVFHKDIEFKAANHLVFDTAWSPPTKWLYAVSKEYPRLIFELAYSEARMMFAGVITVKDGETLSEEDVTVSCDDEAEADEDECQPPNAVWLAHLNKYQIHMGG